MNNCAHQSNEESDHYRISDLPDEMLQRILSFLETKEAARNSVLSKRWVNLWCSLPSLNFRPSDHLTLANINKRLFSCTEKKEHGVKFKTYVETVLSYRQSSPLHTFQVQFPDISDKAICSDLVQICVSYALKHNCQVFSMTASIPSEELWASIFACKSLEEMFLRTKFWTLYGPKVIPDKEIIPEVVNLPHIRRLHLMSSTIDSKSISRLLLGCPVLEELTLENGHIEGLCIFKYMFKYLHLIDCRFILPHYTRDLNVTSSILRDTVESTIWIGLTRVEFIWKISSVSTMGINPSSVVHNFLECIEFDNHLRCLAGVTVLKIFTSDFQMVDTQLKKVGVEIEKLREEIVTER